MTDYKGLVKKIRACSEYVTCFDCDIRNDCGEGLEGVLRDAADAIEELQATIELMQPYMPDFFPDANKAVLRKMEVQDGQ